MVVMARWLLGYFLVFGVAALFLTRVRPGWRRSLVLALVGALIVVCGRVFAREWAPLGTVGDWWPVLAIPVAYWVPAPLAGVPNEALERRLMAFDLGLGRLLAPDGVPPFIDRLLEAAYLMVYPMVPIGLVAVLASAGSAPVGRYWQTVLLAVLPCYALLPVLTTRPPRAVEAQDRRRDAKALRDANLRFMDLFSNHWNTVPSAHASGAVAVAVEVARAGSPLAPAFALLALGIATATVRGRYHYAVDTVAGVVWAGLIVLFVG
jgi:PAP2 superfamily